MPNDEGFDRYNMHYIYSPPWMRRADRFAGDSDFLAEMSPLRRALLWAITSGPMRPSPAVSRRSPSRIEPRPLSSACLLRLRLPAPYLRALLSLSLKR